MPTVLFVCTANIIRSPVAGAFLSHRFSRLPLPQKWQTASAGTWARDGYPAATECQLILKTLGLDLSRHRSRMVNEALLRDADLVLVMEQGHKEALQFEFPSYKTRIFLLSEMVGFDSDIRDPVGGSHEDFQETIREISELIDRGLEKILSLAGFQANIKHEKDE